MLDKNCVNYIILKLFKVVAKLMIAQMYVNER
jgi:hypothetical protein